jgi:hypothetical protein
MSFCSSSVPQKFCNQYITFRHRYLLISFKIYSITYYFHLVGLEKYCIFPSGNNDFSSFLIYQDVPYKIEKRDNLLSIGQFKAEPPV